MSERYVPKSLKRRGAFIRYVVADNVIWLLKPDVVGYFAQLKRHCPVPATGTSQC